MQQQCPLCLTTDIHLVCVTTAQYCCERVLFHLIFIVGIRIELILVYLAHNNAKPLNNKRLFIYAT